MNTPVVLVQKKGWGKASIVLFWAMVLGTVAVSAYAHWLAGYSLPPPWIDEPWFLWTSVELCEHGQWASPSLRPGPALVLSPLYALMNAGLFKVFGVDLGVARWGSWVCTMVAFVGILRMLRHVPWKLAMVACACVFTLGPSNIVAGNMARTEAMLWMLTVWGCALAEEGKTGPALALSALGVNLHMLGLVFFGGVMGVSAVQWYWRWRNGEKWSTAEKAWLGVSGVLVLALMAIMVWRFNPATFQSAMAEDSSSLWHRLRFERRWLWMGIGLGGGFLMFFRERRKVGLLALGVLGMIPILLRRQWWYSIYEQQGYVALLVGVVCCIFEMLGGRWPYLTHWAAGLASACMLLFAHQLGFVAGPNAYAGDLKWWGEWFEMKLDPTRPEYLTKEDKEAVIAELEQRTKRSKRPLQVLFFPPADGMFYHGSLPEGLIPYIGVRTDVPGDVVVFHHSKHTPFSYDKRYWERVCNTYSVNDEKPFHEREDGDWWVFGDLLPNATCTIFYHLR